MSNTNKLDAVAVTEFRSEVGHALGANALIYDEFVKSGGIVNTSFVGEVIKAPHAGKLFTRARGERTSIVAHQALDWTQKSANLSEHTILTYNPNLGASLVNFSERQALVKTVKNARDLRSSQYIINALEALSTSATLQEATALQLGTTVQPVAAFNTSFLIKLTKAADVRNIPSSGRVVFINSIAKSQLLEDEKYISSDYNKFNVLNEGNVTTYLGWKIIVIDNDFDAETGEKYGLQYDNATETVNCYAMHVSALYPVYSQIENGELDIFWNGERRSWGIAADVRGGCLVLDEEKIIKIVLDNSSEFDLPEAS